MKQICMAVSLIVGTGVFGISGLALEVGGRTGSLFGWAVAALAIVPFLVVFHALGKENGEPTRSRVFEFLALSTYTLIVPTIAYVGSSYLQQAMGWSKEVLPFLTMTMLTVAMAANSFGTQGIALLAKASCLVLIALLAFTVFAHSDAVAASFAPAPLPEWSTVWKTASLVFFAFIGWENLSTEKRPAYVYVASFAFVVLLYGSLALVFSGSARNVSGVTGLLELLKGIPGGSLFIVGSLLVILANVAAWMHGASRRLETSEGALRMYVLYVLVASLLISNLVKVETLFQLVNKNFLVVYSLMLVMFLKQSTTPFRLVVAALALVSCGFLIGEIGYELLFPVAMLLSSYFARHLQKSGSWRYFSRGSMRALSDVTFSA